jgi:hypothetical protein
MRFANPSFLTGTNPRKSPFFVGVWSVYLYQLLCLSSFCVYLIVWVIVVA